jgi:tetratricopeptide (TPR) repeat protein
VRLVALLIVAASFPAAAAPQSAAPPPAPPPASADPAREHYERGLAKYNLAEFDAAIVEFKQSYELSKAPRLLFNIAQAYKLKKDYESALYFYNTYLRADPNPPNLDDVESKIDEMKHALDEQKKHQADDQVRAAQRQRELQQQQQQQQQQQGSAVDRRPSRRTLKIAGISVGALGVVAMGVGAGMLGLAASDGDKLHRLAINQTPWTAADDATFREGDRAQTAGIALLSAGGALVIAGSVTLIVARRR